MRVLIVEDDADLAALVLEALAQDGHQAVHVRGPDEARALASRYVWDVFVLDAFGGHLQPDAEYRATVKHLAARGRVVVTTGRAWATNAVASDIGADAMLTKPYDLTELTDALSSFPKRPPV
jgi:two-component system OmpR family response regulator